MIVSGPGNKQPNSAGLKFIEKQEFHEICRYFMYVCVCIYVNKNIYDWQVKFA